MAVQVYSEIAQRTKDIGGFDVSTDSPVSSAQLDRAINDALAEIWNLSEGRIKRVLATAAWDSVPTTALGILRSTPTDIEQIVEVFATSTADFTVASCTTSTSGLGTAVTSVAGFGSVTVGMGVSGTGIPTGSYVTVKTDASNLVISHAATASGTVTLTFGSIGMSSGDERLEPVELGVILGRRRQQSVGALGSYLAPKLYAAVRHATTTVANVNKLELHVFPGVAGLYVPIWYVPQFTAIDSATATTPDVNDLESRDIAPLAATMLIPSLGMFHLLPAAEAMVQSKAGKAVLRERKAMLAGKQDRTSA